MTRIVCISDLHEHLVDIRACDLLLIAGDVSFAFKGDLRSKQAFLAGAKDWLERVPAEEIVLVAGNHDQSIETWGLPDGLRGDMTADEVFAAADADLLAAKAARRPAPTS